MRASTIFMYQIFRIEKQEQNNTPVLLCLYVFYNNISAFIINVSYISRLAFLYFFYNLYYDNKQCEFINQNILDWKFALFENRKGKKINEREQTFLCDSLL